MEFESAIAMTRVVTGLHRPRLVPGSLRIHTHDRDCADDCGGFYARIDLIGDQWDIAMKGRPDVDSGARALPLATTLLLRMLDSDPGADHDFARSLASAWDWHGRPASFVRYNSVVFIDRGPPSVLTTIVDDELRYTETGSPDADSAAFASWPSVYTTYTAGVVRDLIQRINPSIAWQLSAHCTEYWFSFMAGTRRS